MDLALERLTLSYIEMLRGENTGRDRKKVKKLLYYISESSSKIDFENRGRDAPYETKDGCLACLLYTSGGGHWYEFTSDEEKNWKTGIKGFFTQKSISLKTSVIESPAWH